MDLSDLRKQIDRIDGELLEKISKRMEVSRKMAQVKKKKGLQIFQPEREVELLSERRKLAAKFGIPEDMTEELFRLILQQSRNVQQKEIHTDTTYTPSLLRLQKKSLSVKNVSLEKLFTYIAHEFQDFFFLESLGEDEWSEYSFLGFSPEKIISSKGNDLFIDGKKVKNPNSQNPLQQLEEFFTPFSGLTKEKSFCGGLVGFVGTEAVRFFDPGVPTHTASGEFPDFCFGLFLDGLIFDRKKQKLEYFYWHTDRSDMIEDLFKNTEKKSDFLRIKYAHSSASDEEFKNTVRNLQKEILAGNAYQLVPSLRLTYKTEGSFVPFYMRLREVNPSPHMYFIHFGDMQIIGSSPELVARIRENIIETFPIAGTRSRGATPTEDARKAAELLSDEKEVAEHMMLVDMARNDLGRVCEYGSVNIGRLMSIKKFSHVQHIVSEVTGVLKEDVSSLRGMLANFPMGTVVGSPRIEAMKILAREEGHARGPFGGAAGFWSFSGDATFALLIRTLFVYKNMAFVQAGAGVVYDSVPEYELKEVQKKTKHIRKILDEFLQ